MDMALYFVPKMEKYDVLRVVTWHSFLTYKQMFSKQGNHTCVTCDCFIK